ncbi:hypothetical protein B484DRAFT_419185 [Ochromonadaceae sp. CCMP2298]|nr:hypothetical protein B484DRAFT_419185 [Ochromonadaceae sp. CCMP2298]
MGGGKGSRKEPKLYRASMTKTQTQDQGQSQSQLDTLSADYCAGTASAQGQGQGQGLAQGMQGTVQRGDAKRRGLGLKKKSSKIFGFAKGADGGRGRGVRAGRAGGAGGTGCVGGRGYHRRGSGWGVEDREEAYEVVPKCYALRLRVRGVSRYRICTTDPQGSCEDNWACIVGVFTQTFFLPATVSSRHVYESQSRDSPSPDTCQGDQGQGVDEGRAEVKYDGNGAGAGAEGAGAGAVLEGEPTTPRTPHTLEEGASTRSMCGGVGGGADVGGEGAPFSLGRLAMTDRVVTIFAEAYAD